MNDSARRRQLERELEQVQREFEAAMQDEQAAAREREACFQVPPKKPSPGRLSASSFDGKDAMVAASKRCEECDAEVKRLRTKRDRLRKELARYR